VQIQDWINGQFAVSTFICQVALTRRQRTDFCGLRFKLLHITTSLTTQR